MLDAEEVSTKIKEYQVFLEETLKGDLADIQKMLKRKSNEYKEWEEVKEVVKALREYKEKNRDMHARVGIENGIHVNGDISDFERTFIHIGLDYMLEMDTDEADRYADIRMRSLQKDIAHYQSLAVNVKVNIKMVLLAINELQNSNEAI